MFERMSKRVASWQTERRGRLVHAAALAEYQRGEYPANPSIGLGRAFMEGLLDARVLCQHPWTQKALHEGPVYLDAWREASRALGSNRKGKLYLYSSKDALDVAMSVQQTDWKHGWGPQYEGDDRSPALRLVEWVHVRDPQWLDNNLDHTFFSSTMPVWSTLLYHDTKTSNWAMQRWPERLVGHEHPWSEWLSGGTMWFYAILAKAATMPKERWFETASHLARWSPLQNLEPAQCLHQAIEVFQVSMTDRVSSSNAAYRGILWRALTSGVPCDIADPIGAALGYAWPDMHPDCIAIGRHFHPQLENTYLACAASLPAEKGFCAPLGAASSARATVSLYDSPQAWVDDIVHLWEKTKDPQAVPEASLALPGNMLD